ncbi:hypothetical protein PoB_001103500 [Plakobranchus ocellatus]|uniref:Uncharacterized protein n=1 Tax=Plakobranchus ocellatus TaxID=259542 RepID=A0AAV3YN73_9GAST|nr:hypothetical protein PoB_001103500 [Plakobranchus ocellatus]
MPVVVMAYQIETDLKSARDPRPDPEDGHYAAIRSEVCKDLQYCVHGLNPAPVPYEPDELKWCQSEGHHCLRTTRQTALFVE